MKKLIPILLISIFFSCSSSNDQLDNVTLTESTLTGNWKVTSLNYSENNEVSMNGVLTKETSETQCNEITLMYMFSNNPKELSATGTYRAYTSLNNQIYQTDYNSLRGFPVTSNWKILDNKIIFLHPDLTQEIDIISFDGKKLVLKFIYSEYDVDTISNNTFSKKVTTNITLEKE